ncbi:MAG: hypothetical protein OHK0017_07840 [Patescibacteria group bacterium]
MPNILNIVGKLNDIKNNRVKDAEEIAETISKTNNGVIGHTQMLQITEASAASVPGWLEDFGASFSKEWSGKRNDAQFTRLSDEEMREQVELIDPEVTVPVGEGDMASQAVAQFSALTPEQKEEVLATFGATNAAAAGGNISMDSLIQTNILPIISKLLLDDSAILSRVDVVNTTDKDNIPEWFTEPAGETKAENASLTEVNLTYRDGELLDPKNTLSVYTTVTKIVMLRARPQYYGQLQAKMYRVAQNLLVNQILNGDNTGANFHGLFNTDNGGSTTAKRGSFEVLNNMDGALFGANDTNLDRLLSLQYDLPENLSEEERAKYVWIGTARAKMKLKKVKDADGNYIYHSSRDLNGKVINELFDNEWITAHQAPTGKVGFFDLSLYQLRLAQQITFLSDQGIVNFNKAAGTYQLKTECIADGGYAMNLRRKPTWTTGNDDNQEMNAHRFVTLA